MHTHVLFPRCKLPSQTVTVSSILIVSVTEARHQLYETELRVLMNYFLRRKHPYVQGHTLLQVPSVNSLHKIARQEECQSSLREQAGSSRPVPRHGRLSLAVLPPAGQQQGQLLS